LRLSESNHKVAAHYAASRHNGSHQNLLFIGCKNVTIVCELSMSITMNDSLQTGRWDIFCTVVDNFGDIGVCWRLARQLATEHGIAVRLWVDNLRTFQALCPAITLAAQQWQDAVEIRHWQAEFDFTAIDVAAVVVEGFACALPANYRAAMAVCKPAPIWLNLEYLSAETWVGEYHGMPSVQPQLGLTQYFFFPGFEPSTGGLLREATLLAQRDAFQQNPLQRAAFLQQLGIEADAKALLISLFTYENPALPSWLDAMALAQQPVHLLIPQGRVSAGVEVWLGDSLAPGHVQVRGALGLQALTFLPQLDYDRLLWSCDLNCVRGEDSLVRAIWAGRPLLWQPYPQPEQAHLVKLQALLDCYGAGLEPALIDLTAAFWQAWNHGENVADLWPAYRAALPALAKHAKQRALALSRQPDLAAQMVQFYRKLV
jgi:uncharacterized repeat protein (TIGR03837 family)